MNKWIDGWMEKFVWAPYQSTLKAEKGRNICVKIRSVNFCYMIFNKGFFTIIDAIDLH